jgi:hypothetical protein
MKRLWYDGQIWENLFYFKNDKLSTQKIQPILQRILRTFDSFVGILFLSLLFIVL